MSPLFERDAILASSWIFVVLADPMVQLATNISGLT
jgi:hypothetical protein